MKVLIWIAVVIYIPALVHAESNPYKEALLARPWESVQNYVTVRPGAHMFYWLYYANGTRVGAESKPLIIWLQGGPGLAASGVANFAEIGPLTMNMTPRSHTWVKRRNVLLLDHPVGTGFSYVMNNSLLVKTDDGLVGDIYEAIKEFFKIHEEFRRTPTYLVGQSYGGKICPILAYYLHSAIKNKSLNMNLKGIGLGSSSVDPRENALMYPEFLYHVGLLDQHSYLNTTTIARRVGDYIDRKDYAKGMEWLTLLFKSFDQEIGFPINPYNIYKPSPFPELDLLETKINTYVKPMLSHVVDQNLTWVNLPFNVYDSLNESFLVPSTKFVEKILNETELKVAVYNGNLDVVTPLVGASNWVHKLQWHRSKVFKRAKRHQIRGKRNGSYKKVKQLSLWKVFRSGHWVPEDNPVAMEHILDYLISDYT